MNRKQRLYARHIFELRVRQAKGEQYQALFNNVMALRCPGFVPMRPYGNVGDRKNDGYVPASGIFYQVYAPVDPQSSLGDAAKKAKDDFAGLHGHWNTNYPVKEYRFAFNDEYSGSIVPLEDALAQISRSYSIPARPFLAKDLEAEAFELPPELLERALDILLPEPGEINDADFAAVREVIQHVLHTDAPTPPTGKLLAPDFSEKIQFNRLSSEIADLLRVAARQTDVVDDFFSNRAGAHRQDLRDHLADIYVKLRAKKRASPDVVFFGILDAMMPAARKTDRQIQNAALIVMAYYFEACDIFETPDAAP